MGQEVGSPPGLVGAEERRQSAHTAAIGRGPPPADAEWDLELSEFRGWLAKNGDDRVTAVVWGDEPGTQAW